MSRQIRHILGLVAAIALPVAGLARPADLNAQGTTVDSSLPEDGAANHADLVVKACRVAAREIDAAARVSGPLVPMEEGEIALGQTVRRGDVLALIDGAEAQKKLLIETLSIGVADATRKVAETEYEDSLRINDNAPGTVTRTWLERQRLTLVRAEFEVDIPRVREEIAKLRLEWHRIVAPCEGVVIKQHVLTGEWVKKGKPVVRIVDLKRVQVEADLAANEIAPARLVKRPATFQTTRSGGDKVEFKGKLTFVSPVLNPDGRRRIVAEIANRMEDERWVLEPGMSGTMIVHLAEEPE